MFKRLRAITLCICILGLSATGAAAETLGEKTLHAVMTALICFHFGLMTLLSHILYLALGLAVVYFVIKTGLRYKGGFRRRTVRPRRASSRPCRCQ